MDSRAIEIISVSAVKNSLTASELLDPFVNENDKEPSWDGSVYVYNKKGKKKDDLEGRMPVQVKGKETNDCSECEISYQMNTSDLRNYLNDGGCILFVVYVGSNERVNKIYYVELTPIKLNKLLKKGKKTKKLMLKEFPNDNDFKTTIFLNCLQNCKKQKSYCDCDLPTVDELKKQGVLEKVVIPFSGFGVKDPVKAILSNEVYLYAKIKGTSSLQPIDILSKDINIKRKYEAKITIDDRLFYTEYTLIENTKETTYLYGSSFRMTYSTQTHTYKINYKNSSKVRILAKDLDFVLTCLEKGHFTINGINFPLESSGFDLTNFNVEYEREQLKFAQDIVKVLDILGCDDDIDVNDMNQESWRNISILIQALINKQPVSGLKEDLLPIQCFIVAKLRFVMCLKKCAFSPKGTYEISDYFKSDISLVCSINEGEYFPTSKYSIFQTNDFLRLSNMNYDVLLPSFKEVEYNQLTYTRANLYLLDLLKAYDLASGEKKVKLLKTCNGFSEWIMQATDDELDPDVKNLNVLQTIKRNRQFNTDEIKQLYQITESGETSEYIKTGAYLLLEQQQAAEIHFANLTVEEQEEFKNYPIYNFWKSA